MKSGASYGLGCLVQKEYKLEIWFEEFDDKIKTEWENCFVEVTGKIFINQIPYLLTQSSDSVKKLSDVKLPLEMLLKGTEIPKKKKKK